MGRVFGTGLFGLAVGISDMRRTGLRVPETPLRETKDVVLDASSASRKCALSSALLRRVEVPLALK